MALLEARPDSDGYPPVNPGKTSPQNQGKNRRGLAENIDFKERQDQDAANDSSYRKTVNERFVDQANKRVIGLEKSSSKTSTSKKASTGVDQQLRAEPEPIHNPPRRQLASQAKNKLLGGKLGVVGAAKVALSRARATAINVSAFSWGSFLYLFFQLPFAILGIVAFGVASVFGDEVAAAGSEEGFWAGLASSAIRTLNSITSLVGVDFAEIAGAVFAVSYVLIIAIGVITLFLLYLQYTLGMLKPLSGEAVGLKYSALLLAVIGYSVPMANILPWAMVWMIAVWLYPR